MKQKEQGIEYWEEVETFPQVKQRTGIIILLSDRTTD